MESFTPRSARWITAEDIIKVRAKQLILPLAPPSPSPSLPPPSRDRGGNDPKATPLVNSIALPCRASAWSIYVCCVPLRHPRVARDNEGFARIFATIAESLRAVRIPLRRNAFRFVRIATT